MQQVVGRCLVGRKVAAHAAQPVVHGGVEQSESLLVALLATLHYLPETQFAHRSLTLFDYYFPSTYYI